MSKLTNAKDIRVFLQNNLAGVSFNVPYFFQSCRDKFFWRQFIHDKKTGFLIKSQKINFRDHVDYGQEIATARFVIRRCGGQIQDERGIWIEKIRDLPPSHIKSFKLIAINLSNSLLTTEGTDNFADLQHLRMLNLSHNQNLDDNACDQIARQFRKSRTLQEIDLSYNPKISVHGLNVLFRIPSIRKIKAINTAATSFRDIDLFTLAAEDERGCQVLVHEDGRNFISDELEELRNDEQQVLLASSK